MIDSLDLACFTNNTNCLPFIIAAAVAPVVSPSRLVGVWIQTGLLYLFLASLFYYLVKIRSFSLGTALLGCLVFLGTKCLFFENGGLSDFRMDLSLYLTFGATCAWYLASMAQPAKRHFVWLGVFASISCLFRATAPIYLLFALLPLCLIDIGSGEKRKEKFIGLAWASAIVFLLAGWFFITNFDFLKYYYVDWNTDANAKIPLPEALRHWKLAQRSVGEPLVLLVLFLGIGTMLATSQKHPIAKWISHAWREREIDWRIGWLAMAPVVLLVARRAGLNPFVVMPAVFGLVLFFILPILAQIERLQDGRLTRFCWVVLIIFLLIVWGRGWRRHSPQGFDTMAAQQSLIDVMLEDSRSRGQTSFCFGVTHLTDMNTTSLHSILLFDRPNAVRQIGRITIDGIQIRPISTFTRPAAADWAALEGDSDNEKVAGLVAVANENIDFLIVPDAATATYIETTQRHNQINQHQREIRSSITSDSSWVRLATTVRTNESEVVEIYRKLRR